MKRLIDLTNDEAKQHFLKCSSYFNGDLPKYISFQPLITAVSEVMNGGGFNQFKSENPSDLSGVNYNLIANKDGKLAWRPYELMHPAIYVSLVNVICEDENWNLIKDRFAEFESGVVTCCSAPVMSVDNQSDVATQVMNWWQKVEQCSLTYSLEFNHVLHTDVTDCYGSLYTHSISWALHGVEKAKEGLNNRWFLLILVLTDKKSKIQTLFSRYLCVFCPFPTILAENRRTGSTPACIFHQSAGC